MIYNFLLSFEKYIINFHIFEYNSLNDKIIGCNTLLKLWHLLEIFIHLNVKIYKSYTISSSCNQTL